MQRTVAVPTVLALLLTLVVISEALDSRRYWPNFEAVSQGYFLKATDGSGFVMAFTTVEGTQNFMLRDESGCNMDYYTYAHGWLWILYSLYSCDGAWLEQWYARPANVTPQTISPQVGAVSAGTTNKFFLDGAGAPTGVMLTSRWRTYIRAVGPEGIHFVSDQVWYDDRGVEVGAVRETFLIGDVPLCTNATQTMPGVRRYTMGNHRTLPETTFRDVSLCWAR